MQRVKNGLLAAGIAVGLFAAPALADFDVDRDSHLIDFSGLSFTNDDQVNDVDASYGSVSGRVDVSYSGNLRLWDDNWAPGDHHVAFRSGSGAGEVTLSGVNDHAVELNSFVLVAHAQTATTADLAIVDGDGGTIWSSSGESFSAGQARTFNVGEAFDIAAPQSTLTLQFTPTAQTGLGVADINFDTWIPEPASLGLLGLIGTGLLMRTRRRGC